MGPSTASLIVAAFGEDTLAILSEHPERLSEVKGIGPKRAAMIAESYLEQQSTRRAMVFLQSYGISPALAVRISRYYGDRTPEIVREIRAQFPDFPIIATGGPTEESILRTIEAGANAITWTPPSNSEIFKEIMAAYRENKPHP